MDLSRLGVVLAVALILAGCTKSDTPPPSSPRAKASSPAASSTVYQESSLDLCGGTDIKALTSDLKLTVDSTDNSPSAEGPGAACMWRMKSADGNLSSLRVQAVVHRSADGAIRAFQAQQNVSNMKSDGPISGLGDQAEGRTLDSDQGFKQSEYMVHLRTGNMTVKVWISLGAKDFTPKATLATKMDALARATLATVTGAWKR
ncbi:MAG TPA: hypothetical protein VFC19_08785 [Candidatus Limnocylindrales bacterium]|nr:hypothetical protein [Candidatus Limnocylindrales bacterium]